MGSRERCSRKPPATIKKSSIRRRRMNWKPELDDLARREAFAREMGGVDKVKRQRDQGRLTVRERIDRLVDADSFHEIGAISGVGEYDEHGGLKHLTPANCVFGRGKIDGRTVVVVGDDFTVRGGSADASISAKPLMAEEMAHDFRLPIIRVIEGSGGGGSVKTIETRGAANLAGGVDAAVDTEEEAFERARRFLSYLPSSVYDLPPTTPCTDDPEREDESLLKAVPRNRRQVYKMRPIIEAVVDKGSFFEVNANFGRPVITGLARLEGRAVLLLASDPFHYGGSWTAEACQKVVRWVDFAETF